MCQYDSLTCEKKVKRDIIPFYKKIIFFLKSKMSDACDLFPLYVARVDEGRLFIQQIIKKMSIKECEAKMKKILYCHGDNQKKEFIKREK